MVHYLPSGRLCTVILKVHLIVMPIWKNSKHILISPLWALHEFADYRIPKWSTPFAYNNPLELFLLPVQIVTDLTVVPGCGVNFTKKKDTARIIIACTRDGPIILPCWNGYLNHGQTSVLFTFSKITAEEQRTKLEEFI